MPVGSHLLTDIWFERPKVEEEEYLYRVYMAKKRVKPASKMVTVAPQEGSVGVAEQIAQARKEIHLALHDAGSSGTDISDKLKKVEEENAELKKLVNTLVQKIAGIESRLTKLESGGVSAATNTPAVEEESEDDDIDLFGSDSEEDAEEKERLKQERLAAYHAKKSKKPAVIAKSSIVLDVKPWSDETDMAEVEKCVRSIEADGLLWGTSKLVEIAFGLKKLQIGCVVEDEKVGTDLLEEEITKFDELVQSVDIAAFNKI